MNTFNTQDYDFLLRTLNQGSLIFKSQSLKRLLSLAINDKKQFNFIVKQVITQIQSLYEQDKQDINLNVTLILTQILSFIHNKQIQQILLTHGHLQNIIKNLGHLSKPNIRKASHTCLLAYLKNYKNFNQLVKVYTKYGLDSRNQMVRQKAINSFQSILILELKMFQWGTQETKELFEKLIQKTQNQQIIVVKAAAQCLVSMAKIQQIKILLQNISTQNLLKFKDFLQKAIQNLNPGSLKVLPDDIDTIIQNRTKKPQKTLQPLITKPIQSDRFLLKKPTQQNNQQQSSFYSSPNKDLETIKVKSTTMNQNTQRRLQKIRNSILKTQSKKQSNNSTIIQKDNKIFGNIVLQGSIKQRTQGAEQLLFKIQANKDKPQFQQGIKFLLPNILKMLKDTNPKLVGTTLRILQLIIQDINPQEKCFIPLLSLIVQKLGDQKISIRQSVAKVIKGLIKKTKKGIWIFQLIENMKKNTNTYLRDQTLGLILYIFQQTPKQDIDCDYQKLLDNIVIYADDPKTKIKIRTLDCLAQIVLISGDIQKYCEFLKKKMPMIFYQMFLEKIQKLNTEIKQKQNIKNNQKIKSSQNQNNTIQISRSLEQQFSSTSRTAYMDKNNSTHYNNIHKRNQSQSDQYGKVNISMDIIKKRVSLLRNPRNTMRTHQKTAMDNYSQKTIDRSLDKTIQDMEVVLPSLYDKKTKVNKLFNQKNDKKIMDVSIYGTIDQMQDNNTPTKSHIKAGQQQSSSEYLSKQDLTPLRQPQRQFKQILTSLKSGDWKVQFQTLNKLRRLVQFNSQIISNSLQNTIHSIIMDILNLVDNLRSSVSKNALLCLNQLILTLNRQLDCELQLIFDRVIKKSSDTNVFISAQVQKTMTTVCTQLSINKIFDKIISLKDNKSIPIKQTCVNCLVKIKDVQKIKDKQYIKLAQAFSCFLFDSNQQVRSKSRTGLTELCQGLDDWYRAFRGKINPGYFKSICQIMTKPVKQKQINQIQANNNNERYSTINNSPKKIINIKDEYSTIKHQQNPISPIRTTQKTVQGPPSLPRRKNIKISNFPSQFQLIQGYLQQCNSSDWKKRIQFITKIKQIALQNQQQFIQYRSAHHFIDTLCKQLIEPNIKVSMNALSILELIFQPLRQLIENNLATICNNLFSTLNSSKSQIKQKGEQLSSMFINSIQPQLILQYITHGILYALPKSRIFLAIKLKDKLTELYENKKQLLFKYIFPLMNKLMDQYKSQMIQVMIGLFNKLHELMGNQMYNHLTKFKEVKELVQK